MTTTENISDSVLVLLAPVWLLYGWFFYFARMRHEAFGWRNGITVVSLAMVSLAALSWPVMALLVPRADWGSGVGVEHQVRWVDAWHRPAFRTLLAALILGLLGGPRLILPIAVACVGTALFWLFSTMP